MSMIQSFLSDTPGLQNFKINPQEIEIKLDGFRIPYRLPGHATDADPSGEITMDNTGHITTTNPVYDE